MSFLHSFFVSFSFILGDRIVAFDMTGPACSVTIAAPFVIQPEPTAYLEAMPHRGNNIFHATLYEDCGAFQFYGIGVENIINELQLNRMGGIIGS